MFLLNSVLLCIILLLHDFLFICLFLRLGKLEDKVRRYMRRNRKRRRKNENPAYLTSGIKCHI